MEIWHNEQGTRKLKTMGLGEISGSTLGLLPDPGRGSRRWSVPLAGVEEGEVAGVGGSPDPGGAVAGRQRGRGTGTEGGDRRRGTGSGGGHGVRGHRAAMGGASTRAAGRRGAGRRAAESGLRARRGRRRLAAGFATWRAGIRRSAVTDVSGPDGTCPAGERSGARV